MIKFQRNYIFLIGVMLACSLIFQQCVEGKPWGEIDRRKRIIAQIGHGLNFGRLNRIDNNDIDRRKRQSGSYPMIPVSGSNDDDDDYDLDRNARNAAYGNYRTTFPPFPGDEDDYDRYFTEEPERTTRLTAEKETNYSNSNEFGSSGDEDESQSWRKVVPWFKRQWGRTKDFFKNQYNAASNHIG